MEKELIMRILVTGGTGILSSAVVKEALSRGHQVTMINRGRQTSFINNGAKLIISDIRDRETVLKNLAGLHFDVVIDFLIWNKNDLYHSLDILSGLAKQYIYISSKMALYGGQKNGLS